MRQSESAKLKWNAETNLTRVLSSWNLIPSKDTQGDRTQNHLSVGITNHKLV